MNTVSIVLTTVAAIVLVLMLLAFILPRHYSVAVSETIHKPKKIVYDYVSLSSNQTQYSEWLKADPLLQPSIIGTDGTVGSVLKWESHNEDKNKMLAWANRKLNG